MLSYLDPTKPIRWMLGYKGPSIEGWKLKRIVLCWHCIPDEQPMSPGRDRGFEVFDWRADRRLGEGLDDALAKIERSDYERVMIATTCAKFVEELGKRGGDVVAIICPENAGRVAGKPPTVKGAVVETLRRARVANAVRKHLGLYSNDLSGMGVEILSDDADGGAGAGGGGGGPCEEMATFCPFDGHAKALVAQQETLQCLLAVAENLLYRSCEERYTRVLAGSDRFYKTIGRFPPAVNVLLAMGFELKEETEDSPKQWVYDVTHGVNSDVLQTAITVLNRYIVTHAGSIY